MLKTMLLIGAAAVSFPALAQTTAPAGEPAQAETAAPTSEPAPVTEDAQPAPAPAPDASTTPPAGETPPTTETPPATSTPPASGETATAEPAPGSTAATPVQVAQIVDKEFPTYDADASAELSEAEFASWMTKLRQASEPTFDPAAPEVKTWIGQAFAAADADKSKGVSKAELTGFLSRGA